MCWHVVEIWFLVTYSVCFALLYGVAEFLSLVFNKYMPYCVFAINLHLTLCYQTDTWHYWCTVSGRFFLFTVKTFLHFRYETEIFATKLFTRIKYIISKHVVYVNREEVPVRVILFSNTACKYITSFTCVFGAKTSTLLDRRTT